MGTALNTLGTKKDCLVIRSLDCQQESWSYFCISDVEFNSPFLKLETLCTLLGALFPRHFSDIYVLGSIIFWCFQTATKKGNARVFLKS